jgi:hypothetical protein
MTAVMLSVYPEVFAAGGIIAGLPYGTAANAQQAFESMFQGRVHTAKVWGDLVRRASAHRGPWPRVSIWHGDLDATVKPVNAESLIRQWTDLHGIDAAPAEDTVDGYPRKVWRRDGVDVIESHTITGMAHGTPLATKTHGGKAGPFLLEAGISSSYHIARFFGLTGETRVRTAERSDRATLVPDDVEVIPDERVEILDAKADGPKFSESLGDGRKRPDAGDGRKRPDAGNGRKRPDAGRAGPVDVMAIITKALTSAGLMKPPA